MASMNAIAEVVKQDLSKCLREDVQCGAPFVFTNRRYTLMKVLFFDGCGCG